jgi:23S rRNA pseudouridine1911/1915/1917 synthase
VAHFDDFEDEENELILTDSTDNGDELYEHFRLTVDKGQTPLRIDRFLTARMENKSRNRIQSAAKAGAILVNGKAVKSNYKLKPLDEITIVLAHPPVNHFLVPENIPLNIPYEDEDLLIVNKVAGMVAHPGVGNFTGTLVNALSWHLQNLPQTNNSGAHGEDHLRPGLVHRIDKHTSGLLVIAKNEDAMTFLAKQFFDKTVERKYITLVWGNVEEDSGTIEGNIGRDERNRKLFTIYRDGSAGKPAVTHYRVLKRFGYVTLCECVLETGRTHQIRVHMKSIGHTVFNDDRYEGNRVLKGPNSHKYKSFVNNCFELIPGQALHAKTLGFIHPTKKQKMLFDSELTEGFQQLLDKWENFITHTLKGTPE